MSLMKIFAWTLGFLLVGLSVGATGSGIVELKSGRTFPVEKLSYEAETVRFTTNGVEMRLPVADVVAFRFTGDSPTTASVVVAPVEKIEEASQVRIIRMGDDDSNNWEKKYYSLVRERENQRRELAGIHAQRQRERQSVISGPTAYGSGPYFGYQSSTNFYSRGQSVGGRIQINDGGVSFFGLGGNYSEIRAGTTSSGFVHGNTRITVGR
jgi:hypothetical protein